MLGKTQKEMANVFNISVQSYRLKEKGITPFSDNEKLLFRDLLQTIFPEITIDEVFFYSKSIKS